MQGSFSNIYRTNIYIYTSFCKYTYQYIYMLPRRGLMYIKTPGFNNNMKTKLNHQNTRKCTLMCY